MGSTKKTTRIIINVMKNKVQIGLIILGLIFLNTDIFARTKGWKTEKSKDGKITAKYKISKRTDKNGDKLPLIEYTSTTIDGISMQNCISLIKDVSKHKEFEGDDVSKKIKTISENEWIIYYYTKGPGPFPDSDCVLKMTFSEGTTGKIAVFNVTAAPSMFEKTKARRFTYYNYMYTFKDLENGKVEVTLTVKMSPPFKVPLWMVRAAFPDGAFKTLRNIVKLAKRS